MMGANPLRDVALLAVCLACTVCGGIGWAQADQPPTAPGEGGDLDGLKKLLGAVCGAGGVPRDGESQRLLTAVSTTTAGDHQSLYALRRQTRDAVLSDLEAAELSPPHPRAVLLQVLRLTSRPPSWFGETLAENLQGRGRMAEVARSVEHPSYFFHQLALDGLTPEQREELETKRFLTELRAANTSLAPTASEDVRSKLSVEESLAPGPAAVRDAPARGAGVRGSRKRLALRELTFQIVDRNGQAFPLALGGIQPAGLGVDVVWGFSNWHGRGTRVVCLMHAPGRLIPIYETDNRNNFCASCYDGQHVWILVRGLNPRVLLIDPDRGSIAVAQEEPGRFRIPPQGVALGPGKVLWVGSFRGEDGNPRYLLKAEAIGPDSVDIYHLSVAQPSGNAGPHRKPTDRLPANPIGLLPLAGEDGRINRLVIGCGSPGNVLLDLQSLQAATLISRMPTGAKTTLYQGALYWTTRKGLWRLGPKDLDSRTPIASVPEEGCVHFDATGRIYLIGRSVWSAAGVFAPFQPVRFNPPERYQSVFNRLLPSNHFGTVLLTSVEGDWRQYKLSFHDTP